MNNTPDACLSFTRPSAWMAFERGGAPLDSSRIKRGRLENAKLRASGCRDVQSPRPAPILPGREEEIPEALFRCDILAVDPVHGSDPPPAMAGGINVANRQRSSQEVITVRSNPADRTRMRVQMDPGADFVGLGLFYGVRHPRSACRRRGPGLTSSAL